MATQVEPREALWRHLREDQDIAALVGDRIYHQVRPDGAAFPCIVVFPISDVPRRYLGGVAWREARVQLTVMGTVEPDVFLAPRSLKTAEQVARAVQASVEGFSGLMAGALQVIDCRVEGAESVLHDYDDGSFQAYIDVDVVLTYKTS